MRVSSLPVSNMLSVERAPYDPRSVTETFEMWTATAPPAGFTWGYDSRSTTENYVQWLTSVDGGDAPATEGRVEATGASTGIPSVTPSVYSWYDAGVRISENEPESAAKEVAASATPSVASSVNSWYDAGVRLSPEATVRTTTLTEAEIEAFGLEATVTLTEAQVKAYGGPAVRSRTYVFRELTFAERFYSEDTVVLTEQQVKAYGSPAVRWFAVDEPAAGVSSWYDAGGRLTWPTVGGSSGYHRMAGRGVKPPKLPAPEQAWPTVSSWYDAGGRLTWPTVGGSSGYHRMAGRGAKPTLPVPEMARPVVTPPQAESAGAFAQAVVEAETASEASLASTSISDTYDKWYGQGKFQMNKHRGLATLISEMEVEVFGVASQAPMNERVSAIGVAIKA